MNWRIPFRKPSRSIVVQTFAALLVVLVAFIAGALVADSRNAREIESIRLMPAGPAYGCVIPRVQLDRPTFRQAMTKLNELSHADMRVDWDAFKAAEISVDRPLPLALDVRNVTLDQLLPLVLRASEQEGKDSPEFQADTGRLVVSTFKGINAVPPVARVYDIRDMLEPLEETRRKYPDEIPIVLDGPLQQAPSDGSDQLIRLIEDTIDSDSWADTGGTIGSISVIDGRLVVIQRPSAQKEIETLLSELREKGPREKLPEPVRPFTNPDLPRRMENISFHGMPLRQIINALRQRSGANIFVNWWQLGLERIQRDDPIELALENPSLEQCLDALVARLNSSHGDPPPQIAWAVRDKIIVLSAASDLKTGVLYPVVYGVDDGAGARLKTSAAEWAALIKQKISPQSWDRPAPADCDGIVRTPAIRVWANKLIVMQTPQCHQEIESLLAQKRGAK